MSRVAETAHRPWELAAGPWVLAMAWEDLAFLHWPVDPSRLRALVPAGLELETFDGSAWIGVVPFRMSGVRLRCLLPLPWISAFAELNVRTYVTRSGKPGVWFFSLDAANPLAVRGARRTFHLPYFDARMRCERHGEEVIYASCRTHRRAPAADFAARYQPVSEATASPPGSLEHWLTERYCLYAEDGRGRLLRGEIHHRSWPLQAARVEIERNTMLAPLNLELPASAPLCHFARRLDVVAWPLALA